MLVNDGMGVFVFWCTIELDNFYSVTIRGDGGWKAGWLRLAGAGLVAGWLVGRLGG